MVSAAGVLQSEGFAYALDNGAWSAHTSGQAFDELAFQVALRKLGAGCDWAVLPDIVAGGRASLDLSLRWLGRVLDEAPRAMLAVQDGLEAADVLPFLGKNVGIFIGGSTEWKLQTMPAWCALGRQAGCLVHVARVNTVCRILACSASGASSFDGSSASRYAVNVPRLDHARKQLGFFATGAT